MCLCYCATKPLFPATGKGLFLKLFAVFRKKPLASPKICKRNEVKYEMPSAKILESKKAFVKELSEKINGSLAGVVVAYNGISVENDTKLRRELREAGVEYMVVKNTMLRLAVKGTAYEGLTEYFKGDTAIALSPEDPAAAARILCKFADNDKSKRFTVKGGFCDGELLDAAGVKSLSTMPNREGLLSMVAGSLNSIIGGLAVAIQGIVDKQEEEPAA